MTGRRHHRTDSGAMMRAAFLRALAARVSDTRHHPATKITIPTGNIDDGDELRRVMVALDRARSRAPTHCIRPRVAGGGSSTAGQSEDEA